MNRLNEVMAEKKMSTVELGRMTGIHPQTIRIMSSPYSKIVGIANWIKLADILGVDLKYLNEGIDAPEELIQITREKMYEKYVCKNEPTREVDDILELRNIESLEGDCSNLRNILYKLIKRYGIKEKAILVQIEELTGRSQSMCIYCGKIQPFKYDYCGFCGCRIRKCAPAR